MFPISCFLSFFLLVFLCNECDKFQTSSILFVDAPVGTGFSYSTTASGWYVTDTQTGWQVYKFLKEVSKINQTDVIFLFSLLRMLLSKLFFLKKYQLEGWSAYLMRFCYLFGMQWLNLHPQYLNNQLFVGVDSYSGISGSLVVKHIIDGK